MKKEVQQLRVKAINSLIHSIDHFNRPSDRGRTEAVLIFLDHAFEMLLKSAIRHRGGKIRKPKEKQTLSLSACIRKGLTDGSIKFLDDEQALMLQTINGQRDAAQHYLVDISEHHLYFYAQAGVTLFRDIHDHIFDEKLLLELPERVLPVSTTVPKDLTALFDKEIEEIKSFLIPGTRKKSYAVTKARSLAVLEATVNGDYEQPSGSELEKICNRLSEGEEWQSIFPGVAAINIVSGEEGPTFNLRLTKSEGIPVHLIKEGEGSGAVVAVKRVNELDHYNLSPIQLAEKVNLTPPKSRALVDYIDLRKDPNCFKEIKIGGMKHARYSSLAITKLKIALEDVSIEDVWKARKHQKR